MQYQAVVQKTSITCALNGKLTAFNHDTFRTLIQDVVKRTNLSQCVLELSDLRFIDSGGLGMVLLAKDEFQRKGIALELHNPKGDVKRLLDVAKFDSIVKVVHA
jgi:HptB-dependent secretion and biofilm anti anti-sigma factor